MDASDPDFRPNVSMIYGIHIQDDENDHVTNAYFHFGVPPPTSGSQAGVARWYRQTHHDCLAWLPVDENQVRHIAHQYEYLIRIEATEAKYVHRAQKYFFLDDDLLGSKDRERRHTWSSTGGLDQTQMPSCSLHRPSATTQNICYSTQIRIAHTG